MINRLQQTKEAPEFSSINYIRC